MHIPSFSFIFKLALGVLIVLYAGNTETNDHKPQNFTNCFSRKLKELGN